MATPSADVRRNAMTPEGRASAEELALAAELVAVKHELARSRHRFRSAFGNQFQFMAILSPEGRVVDFNRQLAPGVELPREEMIGLPFWRTRAFIDQPGAEAMWRQRLAAAAASSVPILSEDPFTSSSDQPRWATAAVHAVRDEAGILDCFIVQATDITDRKEAEALQESMEAQLRQNQKIQAVGSLAGGIAHDFNNIVGVILSNVSIAADALVADHPALASLAQIKTAAKRARSLVQQILTFSRQRPHEFVAQRLQPVIVETLSLLRTTLPAAVRLEAHSCADQLWVRCDSTQIQQVLMNLCTNAWHSLIDGCGRIGVGVEPASDGRVHLWVSDDGIGMDSATQARIFDPFFTTKAANIGTGLGLSVVHGIVTSHGGSLNVESAPGRGSVFHIYLPSVPDDPGLGVVAASSWGSLDQGRGTRVMYLDDDETMGSIATHLLERAGYQTETFRDSGDALAELARRPGDFDVLVTDFNMPGRSGLDVIEAAWLIAPSLPVVLSSGYFEATLYAQAERIGVRHLLRKESMLDDLCRLVAQSVKSS